MRRILEVVLVVALAGAGFLGWQFREKLSGYTNYTSYVIESKRQLAGQAKFLAATVDRHEEIIQRIDAGKWGFKSSAFVHYAYQATYSFGFDLSSQAYDLREIPEGLEVRLKKPFLVAGPVISNKKHEILSTGVLTDEKEALLQIERDLPKNAATRGASLASDPEVLALCEKKLIEFLRDFLSKQPGVKQVPQIFIKYV